MKALFALADREAGSHPDRYDFPTLEEYVAAFHYWRAVRRDATLTAAEGEATVEAAAWRLGVPFP